MYRSVSNTVCQNANVSIKIKASVDVTNLAKFESFLLVRGEFSTAFPFFICAKTLRLSGLVYYLVCMSLYREQQRVICGINGLNSIQQQGNR